MDDKRNEKLQELCRGYLRQLRPVAERIGLGGFVDSLIQDNVDNRCKGTEQEALLLARACDDERVSRQDIPKILGKSYRKCCEDGDFDSSEIIKLRHVGIYSKVSAILFNVTHGGEKDETT